MTLPASRDATLAAGDVIPSAIINDLQDAVVSEFGAHTRNLGPSHARQALASDVYGMFGTYLKVLSGGFPSSLVFDLGLREGDRLKSVTAYVHETNGSPRANMHIDLATVAAGSTGTSLLGSTNSTGTVPGDTSIASGTLNHVVAAGERVMVTVNLQTANDMFQLLAVTFDRPAY